MGKRRQNFSNSFKAKVGLEAIKGEKTLQELGQEYSVHPNAIGNWKKAILENIPSIFDNKRGRPSKEDITLMNQLYQQIGKLQVELEWLKKKHESIY